jgi:Tol biopolymer transport system component
MLYFKRKFLFGLFVLFLLQIILLAITYEKQLFIFKTYDFASSTWTYYKTDLYHPTNLEKLKTPLCKPYTLGSQYQIIWSPNANYYVCIADDPYSIEIRNSDDAVYSRIRNAGQNQDIRWIFEDWSPDSQYISVLNTVSADQLYYDFSIVKIDGEEIKHIFKDEHAPSGLWVWSPDGKYLLMQSIDGRNGILRVFDMEGNTIQQLALSQFKTDKVKVADNILWSSDNQNIAFLLYDRNELQNKLFIWNIVSGKVSKINTDSTKCILHLFDWSIDNNQIILNAYNCENHISGDRFDNSIYVLNIDESQLTSKTDQGNWTAYWSPDGKNILLNGNIENKIGNHIYIADENGENAKVLIKNAVFVKWIIDQ